MISLVLLDTSLWTCALRRKGYENERAQVFSMIESGQAAWCDAVRLELWRGVSSDYDRNMLVKLANEIPNLPMDQNTWNLSFKMASLGRANGKQFPSPDLLIFSCAYQHRVKLLSRDKHFDELNDLLPLFKDSKN